MSKREEYEAKTEALLAPIAKEAGVEIYDIEYVRERADWYLRAYIDREGGVTIDDCETVSRALSQALDDEDFIQDAYILEVSSPGLGRVLKKDRHLAKSIGEDVEIRLYSPVDKCKDFSGTLTGFNDKEITILQEGVPKTFDRKEVASVRLALDL